jgi:AcrR family transcriptional regulator
MKAAPPRTKTDIVSDFRRTQILDAARRRFASHGLSGTTIDEIAREAGVAKGTVYLYYKSKDEILLQLVERDLAELEAETVAAISAAAPLDARLRGFFAATLGFFDRNRDFVDNCHVEMTGETRKRTFLRYERVFLAQRDAWERAIRGAIASRDLPRQDAANAATSIVALAQGHAKQRLRGWTTGPIEALVAQAAVFALKGLASK